MSLSRRGAKPLAYGILVAGVSLTAGIAHQLAVQASGEGRSWMVPLSAALLALGWLSSLGMFVCVRMVGVARQRETEVRRLALELQERDLLLRRRRAQLEASGAAKHDLLRRTSHNIRSPLTNILGSVDLLLGQDLPGDASQHLRSVRSSAQYLLALANDLLDLASAQTSSISVGCRDVDPSALLAEIVESFRDRARKGGVELVLCWASRAPSTVRTDPTRCREILTNLLDNAVRHTERGRVRVVARVDEDRQALHVSVADTGCGIRPETLATLLDHGEPPALDTLQGRAGVGLVITRHLVDALGGQIEVSSRVGEGSTFSVNLPAGPLAWPGPTSTVPGWGDVLVVDDAPEVLTYMRAALEARGLSVAAATGAVEALRAIRTNPGIGTVLLDASVSGAAGLLREVRGGVPARRVVAFTGDVSPGAESRALADGFDAYLPKPFDEVRLATALARAPHLTARAA